MDLTIFNKTEDQKMSSREIAQLTGKNHHHVLRDCDKLNETYLKIGLSKIGEGSFTTPQTDQNTIDMKLKHFINIVLIIQILWVLAISETQDVKLLSWTMFFLGITFFARVNHKAIVQFFQEKDPI